MKVSNNMIMWSCDLNMAAMRDDSPYVELNCTYKM